jgi:hypothetical protein
MHHRFEPKVHHFDYRIFMLAVDLDDLGGISRGIPMLSVNGRNLYSFWEDDYLPTREPLHNASNVAPRAAGATGLKERVLAFLSENGIESSGMRVMLLTLPRVAGYLFNPVSFYFCTDAGGAPIAAIAEVTNTFREVKPFLLGPSSFRRGADAGAFCLRVPKHFYVSPFSDVDVAFDFTLCPPGEGLSVRIDDYKGAERTLTSTLTGRRKPLNAARLAWFTLKYPLITLKVIALIHVQALLLRLRGVPWFAKAARAPDQRDLYRPHESIATSSLS